ncbi:MAG TPA: iron ABC transporter permease [Candidatus Baltobacteraceae bacterium]|jgi:iron complex transport system permease protein|nr:iron ABC transporter permease [Candidatus Baltobacteraceae bacterium]
MIARLAALLGLAILAMLGSLLAGGTWIALPQVLAAIAHPHSGSDAATIVWQLRLPRVCIGALVGTALSIAGALLQGLLRNPIVDPFLTGVSAGAAVAIVVGMTAGVALAALPALGFAAGIATALVVAALARRGSGLDATRLILAGVSLSSLFSAIIALVLTRLQTTDAAPAIIGWLAGSLAGRGWNDLAFALPYAFAGVVLAFISVPSLNALRLGDVRAASIGVNVARAQWLILCSASLLTACAVTLSGTVGFVGLIVPHIARRAVGSDVRYALPASAFIGAALTVCADALCRTVAAPTEIPIGVLLAFVGVPAFLYLYLRSERAAAA